MSETHSLLNNKQQFAVRWLAERRGGYLDRRAIIEHTELTIPEYEHLMHVLEERRYIDIVPVDSGQYASDLNVLPAILELVRQLDGPVGDHVQPSREHAVIEYLKDEYLRNPSQRPARVCPEIKDIMERFGLTKTQGYALAARLQVRGLIERGAEGTEGEFFRIRPTIVEAASESRAPGREPTRGGAEPMEIDKRDVFVVHGRNMRARNALFTFLRAIGLHPLEWSEIVAATGKASPYTGQVLEEAFRRVQAVVILMTPDDEARLRQPYCGQHEPSHETQLTPQPRPNVLFEAGMALGLHPNRTVIVEMGVLRPISDISGRHVIRMNNSPEMRKELAQRLQTAGCQVNLGGNDWLRDGDFEDALKEPTPAAFSESFLPPPSP